MKLKTIKRYSFAMASVMFLTNAMPLLTFAVPTKDSLGSLDMNDNGDTVGVDFTQGQTTHYHEEITNEVTENTTVYVSQASSFGVIIPKTIILDGKTKNATYEVSITGNIGGQESIEVVPEDSFLMKQQGKNDIDAIVTQDKTSWIYNEFETKGNGTIVAEDMTAGSWNGQFNFNIFLNEAEPMVVAIDEAGTDLNADATFILGSQKDTLLNELVDSGQITSKSEITTLINVTTDDFENQATATFNVSGFANVGDKVAIYHYDETTSEWEYIATCEVNDEYKITANFNSFSPVAFQVIGSDHTHTHKLVQTIQATCENNGAYIYECACGDRYETPIIAGHKIIAGECSRCDYVVAGLYDTNGVMLCSWEDSGIDAEIDYDYSTYNTATTSGYYALQTKYPQTTKVILPNNITKIGDKVFYQCKNVKEIKMQNGITSIGNNSFDRCTNLNNVEIPNTITTLGDYAFSGSGLTNVVIPNSVTNIGSSAFQSCEKLKSVTLPNNLSTIKQSTFNGCKSLNSISIPTSVTYIENRVFMGCGSLVDITIPDSVTTMDEYVFASCKRLKNVTFSKNMTNISNSTFMYCYQLENITIPDNITSIGNDAFGYCYKLKDVTLPNTLTTLGNTPFFRCIALKHLDVPNSLTSATKSSFFEVNHITYNGALEGAPWGAEYINGYIDDNFLYSDSTKTTLLLYIGTNKNVIIPDTVKTIGTSAFEYCDNIRSVTIPNSVKTIEANAFSLCTKLTNINIPNSVTTIDTAAFQRVPYVTYSGNLSTNLWYATSINGYVDDDFVYSDSTKTTLLAYIGEDTSISIPTGVTTIASYAFYDRSDLRKIKIPNTVTTINSSAFSDCALLDNLYIPNSVTTIGSGAFYNVPHITYTGTATGSPWNADSIN